jgi:GntR family transcriptional regulator
VAGQPKRPTPRHEEIAEDLRARIAQGDYEADGKLAQSEDELAATYSVARGTIRQAVAQLRGEGLVESRRSKGLFVIPWRPIPRNSPQRLSVDQWGTGKAIWDLDLDGRDLEVRDVQIEQLPATANVARSLGISEGALVWRRSRRYLVEGVPVQAAVSYLPAGLVEGSRITQVDTGPGGTPARLKELGHEPVRHREVLRSRMPTIAERTLLDLRREATVLDIVRVSWDAADLPVERTEMLLDGSRYVLGYDF